MINGDGTYGWVKATNTTIISTAYGTVTGNHQTSSYRAEAQGVADGLYSGPHPDNLQVYLDNEGVVKNLNKTWPLHPLQPEWEIMEPTRLQIQSTNITVRHIKGHQDLCNPKTKWEAHLNHKADRLANKAHTDGNRTGYQPPGYKVILYIEGNPITTNYTGEIQRAATTPAIRTYYIQKYNWSDEAMQAIDWDAYGGAMNKFTISQQRTLHKYSHGWLPTGNHMEHRYHIKSACPHCKAPENNDHLVKCTSQKAHQLLFLQKLAQKLKTWNTELGIARLIVNALKGSSIAYTGTENANWITQLQQEQKTIGDNHIWKGFMSQTWGDIQDRHYWRQKSPKSCTGAQWSRKLLREIWSQVLQIWTRRNKKLHDTPTETPPHRRHIENLIKLTYTKHKKNPEIFKGLYKHDLGTLLKKKATYLQKWLRLAQPLEHIQKVKTKRQGSQDIRKYLPMSTHPPDPPKQANPKAANQNIESKHTL